MSIRTRNALAAMAAATCLVAAAPMAHAVSIFVNGTQVDGALADYTMEKCTAKFDGQGDLYLNCPGYNLSLEDPTLAAQAPTGAPAQSGTAVPASTDGLKDKAPVQQTIAPRPMGKYVLFTSQNEQHIGEAGFDVDVFINGVLAVRVKNDDIQVVEDLTSKMKKGDNTVTFVARKVATVRTAGPSPDAFIEIQISEGGVDPATETLTITQGTGVTYRITGAELADSTKEMKVVAR